MSHPTLERTISSLIREEEDFLWSKLDSFCNESNVSSELNKSQDVDNSQAESQRVEEQLSEPIKSNQSQIDSRRKKTLTCLLREEEDELWNNLSKFEEENNRGNNVHLDLDTTSITGNERNDKLVVSNSDIPEIQQPDSPQEEEKKKKIKLQKQRLAEMRQKLSAETLAEELLRQELNEIDEMEEQNAKIPQPESPTQSHSPKETHTSVKKKWWPFGTKK
eukprot:TRINITY_DN10574_c0_g1_i2.p1 TRINITY_DN10574_c0_g1~~TRINITY_DN10574_c0_g1_i2.p1  ORF type:complete len:220 (-),score=47.15 TRINITY_DN10574_c0_g1_i2:175-834(-)